MQAVLLETKIYKYVCISGYFITWNHKTTACLQIPLLSFRVSCAARISLPVWKDQND